jgi:DNA-binding response OmpR family regulator
VSDGILIVCCRRELGDYLKGLVAGEIPGMHELALSCADARRRISVEDFAAVLVVGRLRDGSGVELAADIAQDGKGSVLYVAERGDVFDAHDALDGTGVTILSRPLPKEALINTVRLVLRVEETGGTVEKAKLMLIKYKHFSEPQAHRYLQKLSMDRRLPREVAAQYVIKAIERELGGQT